MFDNISDSGATRLGDLQAMLHPDVQAAIDQGGVVLTTWRELMARRRALQQAGR